MSDRAAFVRAIEADPDDDLPRLAWADWLEDHGDARDRFRAVLIRVQCELVGRPDPPLELQARNERLLDLVTRNWPLELRPPEPFDVTDPHAGDLRRCFRRGCLHGLVVPVERFGAHTAAFAGREPLVDVTLSDWYGRGPLPAGRYLRQVTRAVGWRPGRLLGNNPLPNLRSVLVRDPNNVPMVAAEARHFRLRRLDVEGLYGSAVRPADVARALARTPGFGSLRSLRLHHVGLGADEVQELIASPYLPADLVVDLMEPAWTRRGALADRLADRFRGLPTGAV